MNSEEIPKTGFWFNVGIGLLILNFPLGYGGLAVGAAIAAFTERLAALWAGILVYVLSWVMLGIGTALTGHAGVWYAWAYWRARCLRRAKPPPS